MPAHFRYQTCNETICFPPATADVVWAVRVVGPAVAVRALHGDVFNRIPFGHGVALTQPTAAHSAPAAAAIAGDAIAQLNAFTVAGTTGGYLGTGDFLTFG